MADSWFGRKNDIVEVGKVGEHVVMQERLGMGEEERKVACS